jgi:hypothetical protein
MSTQIFKSNVPTSELMALLEKICVKNEKCFIFNSNAFKKGCYTGDISNFFEICKPHYHISKRKYLDKKIEYNTFTTILRQICNFNKITYTSQIKYDKSTYDIIYYIYF